MKKSFLKILLASILLLTGCVWEDSDKDPLYLPLNDTEYPYCGLPRLVIETHNFKGIRDTESLIPAKLQVYGEKSPDMEVTELNVRGRGNSSFSAMAQYGIKLEFSKKKEILGMANNKDWALIPSYADRSLLRNHITYKLSSWLSVEYAPQSKLVEVYLNREYKGVYLLCETIKVGKNRVALPQDGKSYLLEFDKKYKDGEQVVFPEKGNPIRIHYPKNLDSKSLKKVKAHLDSVSSFMADLDYDQLENWIDLDSYLMNYWVQEVSRNTDGAFKTSLYFTWREGEPLRMGPLWDFDVGYGGWEAQKDTEGWYVRYFGWNKDLFKNSEFKKEARRYWDNHRSSFVMMDDSLKVYSQQLEKAAKNHFKRWPILDSDKNWGNTDAYKNYDEAVDSLRHWIKRRIQWIDNH